MKPILFNTSMVKAILDGRKTVTRRVVKGVKSYWGFDGLEMDPDMVRVLKNGSERPIPLKGLYATFEQDGIPEFPLVKAPYSPGDILYVRETWGTYNGEYYLYRADYPGGAKTYDYDGHTCDLPIWRPSIHMPKEAARLFLRVTDVRVERLQDMQPYEIAFEGFRRQKNFMALWDKTIKKADLPLYGWAANPWVWVIEFERTSKEEAIANA